jgi:ribosomal protein S18 acetylase RimI-like enzyme
MVLLMRVTLREAQEEDMSLIKKYTVETGWEGIPESQKTLLDREKWSMHMVEVFENFHRRENSQIFVAEDESCTFVGYLFVGESSDILTGLSFGFVYDIFVEEKHRGKGIGKMFLIKAESYCREKGYSRIALMVSAANNSATRLYDSLGFKPEQIYMGKELK